MSGAAGRYARAIVVGASGGIGGALVEALRAAGSEVVALSRSASGDDHIEIEDEASIATAAERVRSRGTVDLVIVATGVLKAEGIAPEKSMRDLTADTLPRYFAVNTIGPALVAKHFLPLLSRGPSAFAALSARVGSISDNRLGGWHGYRASKAALNMMIRTLAIELTRTRPEAVCVALHPGTVDTGLSQPFQRGVPSGQLFTPQRSAEAMLAVLAGLTPADSGGCFAWDGQRIAP